MENLTGGTPPVRYLLCVVPCKLYFPSVSETVKEIPRGCGTGSDGGPARDTAANEPGSGGRKDIYCAERRFPLEDRKTVLWEWGTVFENRKCERG
nr:MAG TPA: hypothetical protein [Caudoviricetes sp.]